MKDQANQEPTSKRDQDLMSALGEIAARLVDLPKKTSYESATKLLDNFLRDFRLAAATSFAPVLEKEIRRHVHKFEIHNQKAGMKAEMLLPQKQDLSKWINEELRKRGFAIVSKGYPCRIGADELEGNPGVGRFRLGVIGTKHMQMQSRKNIIDLFPFILTEAPQRIEPLARWSDRVDENDHSSKHRKK